MLTPEVAETLERWRTEDEDGGAADVLEDIKGWTYRLSDLVEAMEERFTNNGKPPSPMAIELREILDGIEAGLGGAGT